MYDKDDPRAALAASSGNPVAKGFGNLACIEFHKLPPGERVGDTKTWYGRGQNFLLAFTQADSDADLSRADQADEYAVLLPDRNTSAKIDWCGTTVELQGPALAFVPAGPSVVAVAAGCRIVRLFTTLNADLVALCANAQDYARPAPNLPEFAPWPRSAGEDRVRAYNLDIPSEPGRFGRIFRSRAFMVNILDPKEGPRDISKMSPHAHADFEQCSLTLQGDFVHHVRWPWVPDMHQWREDVHMPCGSPAMTVIPAQAIHTSQAVGKGTNILIDIFSPPRHDFSAKPGWVLNADDYPMPEGRA